MEIFIAGEKKRINPYNMKYSEKLPSGSQVNPYIVNDQVYKLYKEHLINEKLIKLRQEKTVILTKEKVEFMKKIPTKRILLPREGIYNKKRKLIGYITEYIKDLEFKSFTSLESTNLIRELKLLKEDLCMLEDNSILINDLIPENVIYNRGIYLIDPGSYQTKDETNYDSVVTGAYNNERFNEFIINKVFITTLKNNNVDINLTRSNIKKEASNYYSVLDYLIENIKEDNLLEFIKRKAK